MEPSEAQGLGGLADGFDRPWWLRLYLDESAARGWGLGDSVSLGAAPGFARCGAALLHSKPNGVYPEGSPGHGGPCRDLDSGRCRPEPNPRGVRGSCWDAIRLVSLSRDCPLEFKNGHDTRSENEERRVLLGRRPTTPAGTHRPRRFLRDPTHRSVLRLLSPLGSCSPGMGAVLDYVGLGSRGISDTEAVLWSARLNPQFRYNQVQIKRSLTSFRSVFLLNHRGRSRSSNYIH